MQLRLHQIPSQKENVIATLQRKNKKIGSKGKYGKKTKDVRSNSFIFEGMKAQQICCSISENPVEKNHLFASSFVLNRNNWCNVGTPPTHPPTRMKEDEK